MFTIPFPTIRTDERTIKVVTIQYERHRRVFLQRTRRAARTAISTRTDPALLSFRGRTYDGAPLRARSLSGPSLKPHTPVHHGPGVSRSYTSGLLELHVCCYICRRTGLSTGTRSPLKTRGSDRLLRRGLCPVCRRTRAPVAFSERDSLKVSNRYLIYRRTHAHTRTP